MHTLARRSAAALAPALLAALAAPVAGCGSGDASPSPSPVFVQATVGPDATLKVGGVPFSSRGAVLRMLDDGTSVTLASDDEARTLLREGMVVAVRGDLVGDARSASEILYRSVVRGPLIGRAASQLAVAGADVDLDAETVVLDAAGAPTTPEALPAGGRVEVSGWPETGNRVRATLVRALPGTPAVSVRGWTLSAPVGGAFDLSLLRSGSALLRVDASGASGPPGVPADALVRVSGSTIAAGAPPSLAAESYAVESQILPRPGDLAVVEGVVTGGTAAALQVGEHLVATTSATTYEAVPAGGTAAPLAPGMRLVAEGTLDGERIVAQRIRFVALARLAGRMVPTSFAIGNPATFAEWDMGQTTVHADLQTRISGVAGEPLALRDFAELHAAEPAGLPVVVHGYARRDGVVRAHRVDVTPAP